MFRTLLAISMIAAATGGALAQNSTGRGGTPEEQKACSPDVSRYCRDVMKEGDLTILGCLKANRTKISKACDKVLVNNGQ